MPGIPDDRRWRQPFLTAANTTAGVSNLARRPVFFLPGGGGMWRVDTPWPSQETKDPKVLEPGPPGAAYRQIRPSRQLLRVAGGADGPDAVRLNQVLASAPARYAVWGPFF